MDAFEIVIVGFRDRFSPVAAVVVVNDVDVDVVVIDVDVDVVVKDVAIDVDDRPVASVD